MQNHNFTDNIDGKHPLQWLVDEYHSGNKLEDVKEKIRIKLKDNQPTMRVALSAAESAYAVLARA